MTKPAVTKPSNDHPTEDLLARIADRDAEVDAAQVAHVSTCATCSAAVSAFRAVDATLSFFAPRWRNLCPDRSELFALRSGELHGFVKQDVEKHLAACPFCRDDVADLDALETAGAPSLVVRWAKGALSLIENALGDLVPSPAPALVRGAEASEGSLAIARAVGDARLEVLLAPARTGVALVARLTDAKGEPLRFRMELARDGMLVEGQESESGRVHLDELAAGRYELVLYRPGSRAPACEVSLDVRGEATAA